MSYDVTVIGGGPAGFSAALNAASEGLFTLLLAEQIGGQAGTSSLIENYAGFPAGISGPSLISRMKEQAQKFGANITKCCVRRIERKGDCYFITLATGSVVRTRSIIIATGARYNKLDATTPYEGKGVHYACTATSVRRACQCDEVAVVGAGNSAGQAAMFLSTKAKKVHLIVRRGELGTTMSSYLHERIVACENIVVHLNSQITEVSGSNVDTVTLNDDERLSLSDIYVMIGASPNTEIFNGLVDMDAKGFITTDDGFRTSASGIYAVGDCRAGSVKRVANATGEGAATVPKVWSYLNQ